MGVKERINHFLDRAKKKFGNKYDYSLVKYENAKTNVDIICPIHGIVSQTPDSHLRNIGCRHCSLEISTKKQTQTAEEFITRSKLVHGDRYDYSHVSYITARSKVDIICRVHGIFSQVAYSHLIGQGCIKCRDEMLATNRKATFSHFLEKSRKVHGDIYDYSKVDYKNAKTKVTVTCKEHGDFIVIPDAHWLSSGCPECRDKQTGFLTSSSGFLYILQCDNLYKIGITNKSPDSRLRNISKSYGKDFKRIHLFKSENGYLINDLETELLNKLRKEYLQPKQKFDGYTESFFDVDVNKILPYIRSMTEEIIE
jgi:hypothetical protein